MAESTDFSVIIATCPPVPSSPLEAEYVIPFTVMLEFLTASGQFGYHDMFLSVYYVL